MVLLIRHSPSALTFEWMENVCRYIYFIHECKTRQIQFYRHPRVAILLLQNKNCYFYPIIRSTGDGRKRKTSVKRSKYTIELDSIGRCAILLGPRTLCRIFILWKRCSGTHTQHAKRNLRYWKSKTIRAQYYTALTLTHVRWAKPPKKQSWKRKKKKISENNSFLCHLCHTWACERSLARALVCVWCVCECVRCVV